MGFLVATLCAIVVGCLITGIVLITLDRQKEWKARREASKK